MMPFKRAMWGGVSVICLWLATIALPNLYPALCRPSSSEAWFGCLDYWLYRYQTLLGAVATIAAAWIAWRAVQRQIGQAVEAEKNRISREHLAARAILPLSLSNILIYVDQCCHALTAYAAALEAGAEAKAIPLDPPDPPQSVFAEIQACIRTMEPSDGVAKRLTVLLAQIQVLRARLDLVPSSWVAAARFIDALDLYVSAESLFLFARDMPLVRGADPDRIAVLVELRDMPSSLRADVDRMLEIRRSGRAQPC